MDKELILRQFEKIEERVEGLITKCESHEAANRALEQKNSQLETELQQKVMKESQYSEERELIRSKIDGLLAKFDDVTW